MWLHTWFICQSCNQVMKEHVRPTTAQEEKTYAQDHHGTYCSLCKAHPVTVKKVMRITKKYEGSPVPKV